MIKNIYKKLKYLIKNIKNFQSLEIEKLLKIIYSKYLIKIHFFNLKFNKY